MCTSLLTPTTLAVAACVTYLLSRFISSPKVLLPPGPHRWPLIGSALEVPRTHPWLTFAKWAKTYGSIVYAEVAGQPLVVLNSAKIARDLLDQRSAIYSDRPSMLKNFRSGFKESFSLQPYGESWRKQRKIVAHEFSQLVIARYHSLQEKEAKKFICSILDDPSNLRPQLKLRLGTIIIRVAYGYYLTGENDPFLTAPLTAMENFSEASAPGAWLVDFLPMLQYLPKWMPGAGFLTTASTWREIVRDATWEPYLWSKKNLESGTVLLPNICSTALEDLDRKPSAEEEERLRWAIGTVMGGGMDTNTSTVLTFFLAMMLNPDVQAKARKEIDDDKASLPYIRSIMAEVLRWNPAVPMGIPHSLTKDDIYEGMHLPKGSLMIPNVWHMLHDPDCFPNPDDFNPGRYNKLDSEMDKVTEVVFGFGRRVCPGKLFAEGTFFAIATTVLATCEILPVVDSEGNEVVPNITYSSGTISFPSEFEINVKCRSKAALGLLSNGLVHEPK
ncbi:putative monooxygenase [Mycena leptocephala]|nr:putative monooxygenase [Mycena leptocephala]